MLQPTLKRPSSVTRTQTTCAWQRKAWEIRRAWGNLRMHATLSPADSGSSNTQQKPRLLRFSVTVDKTRKSRGPFRIESGQRNSTRLRTRRSA